MAELTRGQKQYRREKAVRELAWRIWSDGDPFYKGTSGEGVKALKQALRGQYLRGRRDAQFDVFHTGWAFRDAKNPKGHPAIVAVRAPREQFGVEMRRAAHSLHGRLIPCPYE